MKQNIRKRVSIAIDSEVARVQYWNSVYLQYWRNKYNQVLLDVVSYNGYNHQFVRGYPLIPIGLGISMIPCYFSSWTFLFVVHATFFCLIKLYLEWVFWNAYIDGIRKNSSSSKQQYCLFSQIQQYVDPICYQSISAILNSLQE